jgi:hypothetical protein
VKLHIVSAVATNYLPFARVLADSLAEQHPQARLSVLVVDAGARPAHEPFELLTPGAIGVDAAELGRRALAYDTQALVSSLKARLLGWALADGGGPALLLDADMLVCGDLHPLAEQAGRHAVLLSPHATTPIEHRRGGGGAEESFLRAGAYNGGLVGVGPGGEAFCAWWDERCARDCVRDPGRRLLLSQTWLDLAPALFGAAITRDPGVNVMGHNLHGRDVAERDGAWSIGGAPLRCFHFASFDPGRPERLGASRESSWCELGGRPGTAALAALYARRLRERGWSDERPAPGFTWLPGGLAITPAMRRAYLAGLLDCERDGAPRPPNPLLDGDDDAFLSWLAQPAPESSPAHPWLTRYLLATHRVRDDLQRTWPLVPGDHTEPYLAWCHAVLGEQDPAFAETERRRG